MCQQEKGEKEGSENNQLFSLEIVLPQPKIIMWEYYKVWVHLKAEKYDKRRLGMSRYQSRQTELKQTTLNLDNTVFLVFYLCSIGTLLDLQFINLDLSNTTIWTQPNSKSITKTHINKRTYPWLSSLLRSLGGSTRKL